MLYDENLTTAEIRLIEALKGKSRMAQDQIIYEYEKGVRNEYSALDTDNN